MKIRTILILLLATFVGGAILSIWAADRFGWFGNKANSEASADPIAADQQSNAPADAAVPFTSNSAAAPQALGPMADRVEELEARLSRINTATEAASGNATRAEGLLIAYSALRSIENGEALGYIENQLRTRFGTEKPAAVDVIIKASKAPVTLAVLQAGLDSQGDDWLLPAGLSIAARVQREVNELFILRRAETPSPFPARRLQRARQYAESGNIKSALAEVEAMPGKSRAQGWINKAKAYIAVREALDIIEREALVRRAQPIAPIGSSPPYPAPQTMAPPSPALPENAQPNPPISAPGGIQNRSNVQ